MALFTNSPEDWQRLDWQILRDGGIALYWRSEYFDDDLKWLAARNYDIYKFDCERWVSGDEMYSDIAKTLRFSEWWGAEWGDNLDALDDCLTDLPIRDEGGAVLARYKFDTHARGSGAALMHSGRNEAEAILDVMARTSRLFLLNGSRFIVLVQTQDPKIQVGLLGGSSPAWNRREWLNKNRIPASDEGTASG